MADIPKITTEHVSKLQSARQKYIEWLKLETEEKIHIWEQRELNLKELVGAGAEQSLTFLVFKGHLTADLLFAGGIKMHFDAWPWGVGLYGGKGFGLYFGVAPNTLAGRCSYHCQGITAPAGILQTTFWRGDIGLLGQIDVAVAGIGAGETGGDDGIWTFS